MIEEEFYWYWINNIRGVSRRKIRSLLETFETPEEIYKSPDNLFEGITDIKPKDIEVIIESKKQEGMFKDYLDMKKFGVNITYPGKSDYPEKLLNMYDYPCILYYKGKLPGSKPSVSIVGARNCTEYGRSVAGSFAAAFAGMGLEVISGMALGIDTAAHKGALSADGYTCAVLGSGVDVCYPRSNIGLYQDILQDGCVLSEYTMGTAPNAGQFPERNRIISGLSDALVVVEARAKSGSLITAESALDNNVDVYVVPGRLGDALSEGCLKYVKEGASLITSPHDILDTLSIKEYVSKHLEEKALGAQLCDNNKLVVAKDRFLVYSQINLFPTSLEIIIKESGMKMSEVGRCLMELELDGLIKEVSKNYYVRTHI